jgi:ASC-1-like (ASCH) protein
LNFLGNNRRGGVAMSAGPPEHRLPIKERHKKDIKSKKKSFDLRLCSNTYDQVLEGHLLCFYNKESEDVSRMVGRRRLHLSFLDTFEELGLDNCLPGVTTPQEVLKLMRKYYSKKKESRYGVLSFELLDPADLQPADLQATRRSSRQRRQTIRYNSFKQNQHPIQQPPIYKVSYVPGQGFLGKIKNKRKKEPLSKRWLIRNHFNATVYQQRCQNNPGMYV